MLKRGIVKYEILLYNYVNLLGHELVLQLEDWEADPVQTVPPFDGLGLLHCRVLVIVPPPHVTPQEVQLDQPPQLPLTMNKYICTYINILDIVLKATFFSI